MKHIPYLYLSLALVAGASLHHDLVAMQRQTTTSHTKRRTPCSLSKSLKSAFVIVVSLFAKAHSQMGCNNNPYEHSASTKAHGCVAMLEESRAKLEDACFVKEINTDFPRWTKEQCQSSKLCTDVVKHACRARVDQELIDLKAIFNKES